MKNLSNSEIYKQLRKYIPRSMAGDNFAVSKVNRLAEISENSEIYESALMDSLSDINASDDYILGKSLGKIIRAAYTPSSELDAYFDLFREPALKPKGNPFEEFCRTNLLNPKDMMIFPITGDSMLNAGIEEGDTAIADISRIPKNGEIGAVFINGKYFIKRIGISNGKLKLISENPNYPVYTVSPDDEFRFIGTVSNIIKRLK